MRVAQGSLIVALGVSLIGCERSHPVAPSAVIGLRGTDQANGGGSPGSMVFHSARDGNFEIYRANTDASDPERLTNNSVDDQWPDISPNGRYVAFASLRMGNRDIFVLDLKDGSQVNVSQSSGDDNWPRWSPNGQQIAFHSNRDGNYNIYVVNADGSGMRRITSNTLLDQWPDWSPNGRKLLFRRGFDIYVADEDGEEQNVVQLTNLPTTTNQMAVWSPNGQQIAFMSLRDGYCAVFLMSANGETSGNPAVNLTPKGANDANSAWCSRAPAWSRNGHQIYFQSMRPSNGTNVELFVMNTDGSGLDQLTSATGEDGGPRVR
jgi:Tol biopolymer transport system component